MSYNQQELFQILSILTSSIYLWLVGALALGMDYVDVERDMWRGFVTMTTSLFWIAQRDTKRFFTGKWTLNNRRASKTEMYVSWTAVILACTTFAFYWASVGMNLNNGTPNAFTNSSNPTTQSWFAVGTALIILVVFSFVVSLVHWGYKLCCL